MPPYLEVESALLPAALDPFLSVCGGGENRGADRTAAIDTASLTTHTGASPHTSTASALPHRPLPLPLPLQFPGTRDALVDPATARWRAGLAPDGASAGRSVHGEGYAGSDFVT